MKERIPKNDRTNDGETVIIEKVIELNMPEAYGSDGGRIRVLFELPVPMLPEEEKYKCPPNALSDAEREVYAPMVGALTSFLAALHCCGPIGPMIGTSIIQSHIAEACEELRSYLS